MFTGIREATKEDMRQPILEKEFVELLIRIILMHLSRAASSSSSDMSRTDGHHKEQKSNANEGDSPVISTTMQIRMYCTC